MMALTPRELLHATGGEVLRRPESWDGRLEVVTDSRAAGPGRVFFALTGPRFDGHDFIPEVLEQAGTGVVGRRDRLSVLPDRLTAGHLVIGVDDPLFALGETARFVRRQVSVPVVGLTGSMGKTTTKELIRHILLQTGPGLATEGNYNNLIGLPLTLFRLESEHRWIVLEMGMNAPGEIRRLQAIGQPDVRLITNIAPAHTEGVGGIDGVVRAKGELFETAVPGNTVVVHLDDPRVRGLPVPAGVERVTFGTSREADVRVVSTRLREDGTSDVVMDLRGERLEVHLALVGLHQSNNAAAAAAVAVALGVSPGAVHDGLRACPGIPMRMALRMLPGGVTVIDDVYNANPASVQAALQTLVALRRPGGRVVAVLGDMMELGALERDAHRTVGGDVAALGVDGLFTIGARAAGIASGARDAGMDGTRIVHEDDRETLAARIDDSVRAGDVVLFKGSRSAGLERVLEAWERRRITRDRRGRGLE